MSVIIAEAIAIRARQDHKLQTALQPLVEESLRISVARDPAMLATSLFPDHRRGSAQSGRARPAGDV